MDIHNLQAFIAVAEKRSFSKSAEGLKLTQPAVSKRIASLESELNCRLFDRVGRTVHLTEAGKVLLPTALKINTQLSRVEKLITNLEGEVGGKLSIGSCAHVCADRLATMLRVYRKDFPAVDIDLQFLTSEEVQSLVTDGSLDLGFCSTVEYGERSKIPRRLKVLETWRDKLKVVVSRNHELTQIHNGTVSLDQLCAFPAILPDARSEIRKALDKLVFAGAANSSVAMESTNSATVRSMASIGMGWGCLPSTEIDNSVVALNVADLDLSQTINLMCNAELSMSRSALSFIEGCQNCALPAVA